MHDFLNSDGTIYDGLGLTDSKGRDATSEDTENKKQLTVAVENFCSSRPFRVELIEAVVRETVGICVREAMAEYNAPGRLHQSVEDITDKYADKVGDIIAGMQFSTAIVMGSDVRFCNEFKAARERNSNSGHAK